MDDLKKRTPVERLIIANTLIQSVIAEQPKPDKNTLSEQQKSDKLGIKTGETCTDCISRQAAIDEIKRWIGYIDEDMILRIQIGLKKVPSAHPEQREEAIIDTVDLVRNLADRIGIHQLYAIAWDMRGEPAQRTGRWKVTPVYIKCSECGESFMLIPQNYCPNCGARMEEQK